jgi:hypothetical protein
MALQDIVHIYVPCEMAGDRSRYRDDLGALRGRSVRKRFPWAGQRQRRPCGRDQRTERRRNLVDGDHERCRSEPHDDGPRRLLPFFRGLPGGLQMRSLRGSVHGAGIRVRIALRRRRRMRARSQRPDVADVPAESVHRQVRRRGRRLVRCRRQLRGLRRRPGLRQQCVRGRRTERRRSG